LLYIHETVFRERKPHQAFTPDDLAGEHLFDFADDLLADAGPIYLGEDVSERQSFDARLFVAERRLILGRRFNVG
jgi:hypothetical protein